MISALIGGMLLGWLVSSQISDVVLAVIVLFPAVLIWANLCYQFGLP